MHVFIYSFVIFLSAILAKPIASDPRQRLDLSVGPSVAPVDLSSIVNEENDFTHIDSDQDLFFTTANTQIANDVRGENSAETLTGSDGSPVSWISLSQCKDPSNLYASIHAQTSSQIYSDLEWPVPDIKKTLGGFFKDFQIPADMNCKKSAWCCKPAYPRTSPVQINCLLCSCFLVIQTSNPIND